MTRERWERKSFLRLARRDVLLAALALSTSRPASADEEDQDDLRNLRLLDLTEGGRRFTLVVPKYAQPDQALPLVVLLHGLGETVDERMGAYAWVEKYGLG